MNKKMYTSLKLSKLLADNGFEGESDYNWNLVPYFESVTGKDEYVLEDGNNNGDSILAYDILNSLCVKYAKEMLGIDFTETWTMDTQKTSEGFNIKITQTILILLQQNKQEEAEEYIWEHCKFNNK